MATDRDPFTGTWKLAPADSRLAGAVPLDWVQEIDATADEVRVRESMTLSTGARLQHSVEARFDGKDYPVVGSQMADTIAYTRLDSFRILGTAKKSGLVVLTETVSVANDLRTLTMAYCVRSRDGQAVNNVAVFRRADKHR